MKSLKKIGSILLIGFVGATALVGCTQTYNQDEVNQMIEDAKASVDITADNADAVATAITDGGYITAEEYEATQAEIDRLNLIIEDMRAAEQEVAAEEADKESKEEIELSLGEGLGDHTYDDGDLSVLKDGEVRFDGDNYDFEELIVTNSNAKLGFSLVDEEEFGADAYLITTDKGAIEYRYYFNDDRIDVTEIDRDEPLTIEFAGKEMIITHIENGEFELRGGDKLWLSVGEESEGVKLVAVSEDGDSAAIEVGGVLDWLDEGDELEFEGLTVALEEVKAIHSEDYAGQAKLVLSTAEDVYQTYEVGDSLVYDEDEDDAEWVYTLELDGDELEYIGAIHNQKMDELDDDFLPLGLGDILTLPNNYAALELADKNVEEYMKVTIEFDEFEDDADVDHNGIIFAADEEDGFEIEGEDVDEVFAYRVNNNNWQLLYEDDDGDMVDAGDNTFKVVFEDTEYTVSYAGNTVYMDLLEFKPGRDSGDFVRLGAEEEDAESNDVLYNGVALGAKEDDILGYDGLVIVSPEDNADEDKIELLVPEEEVEYTAYLG